MVTGARDMGVSVADIIKATAPRLGMSMVMIFILVVISFDDSVRVVMIIVFSY